MHARRLLHLGDHAVLCSLQSGSSDMHMVLGMTADAIMPPQLQLGNAGCCTHPASLEIGLAQSLNWSLADGSHCRRERMCRPAWGPATTCRLGYCCSGIPVKVSYCCRVSYSSLTAPEAALAAGTSSATGAAARVALKSCSYLQMHERYMHP